MEFNEFYQWVHKEIGISLNSYKPTQLNRRIGSLLDRKGIKSLEDYSKILRIDKEERANFLDYITINVTEFFRNKELFDSLGDILQNDVFVRTNKLKIWSAGCSVGCEPYSVAMMLEEMNKKFSYKIIATDLDVNVLARAKEGKYLTTEIKTLEKKYLDKYFTKDDDKYTVNALLKSKIAFKQQDLIQDKYDTDYDLIICRNVTIYFKEEVRIKIIEGFVKSLKKNGILFVGATESINTYKNFGLEKVAPFIYKKA